MSRTTAIVTGATGWLGSRLVECLIEGLPDGPGLNTVGDHRQVRVLVEPGASRRALESVAGRIEVIEGDVTDPQSLVPLFRGAEAGNVFHCAGVVNPRWTSDYYRVNVEGTRNVLAAARKAGVRRVIHVSSDSVLGTSPTPDGMFDELSPYNPSTHYGRSKALGERAVWEAACSGGAQAVVIRPASFYGPNQPPHRTRLLRMIRRGRMPLVGPGENRRSMAYVDNVVQAMLLAEAIERARGQTYWIADARTYTMAEILETMARVLERDFELKVSRLRPRLPRIVSTVARLSDRLLEGVGLYHHGLHVLGEMDRSMACRIQKAVEELSYTPRVDLEEGMRRSVRSLLDQGGSLD